MLLLGTVGDDEQRLRAEKAEGELRELRLEAGHERSEIELCVATLKEVGEAQLLRAEGGEAELKDLRLSVVGQEKASECQRTRAERAERELRESRQRITFLEKVNQERQTRTEFAESELEKLTCVEGRQSQEWRDLRFKNDHLKQQVDRKMRILVSSPR